MHRQGMAMVFFLAVCGASVALASAALARQPDMRDAADMRGQIEQQMEQAAAAAAGVTGRRPAAAAPAATPEKEMERRRALINEAHRDFQNLVGDARAPIGAEGVQRASGLAGEGRGGGMLVDPESRGGEASARDPERGLGVAAADASRRAIPAPPRAIPIEGRVVIQGGEGEARDPGGRGTEIRYTVEERFVGNLIVAELAPPEREALEGASATGRAGAGGAAEGSSSSSRRRGVSAPKLKTSGGEAIAREYQIDTISTGVHVQSLDGGVCLRTAGGDGEECVEREPFATSAVGRNNRYGSFDDGVVAAETESGKVKIEVASPDVAFSTRGGREKAKVNCSRAVFELGIEEFKRLADAGEIALSKEVGGVEGATPSCRAGSRISLTIRVKGR
jgi:hypothetical protein